MIRCSAMIALALSLLAPMSSLADPPGTIRGVVLQRGTRAPLTGITVYLTAPEADATTGSDGTFVLRRVPAGRRRLVVASPDHLKLERRLRLSSGQTAEVTLYLEPRSHGALEVVVRGRRQRREIARASIAAADAEVVAGGGGDPVKAMESMPVVTRGGAGAFGVPVRGSNPEDSRILLDGHELPILFHMDSMRSTYNSALLSDITLLTGGFGAEHGGATGDVVALSSRAPRADRWGGHVDISLQDASALAEGPLTDDMAVAVALRRSVVDAFLPLVLEDSDAFTMTTLPSYYDYQAK